MDTKPVVTILVPMRNEAADIAQCIEAIGKQDYPLDRLEVICVDGDSSDRTFEVVKEALERFDFGTSLVVLNPDASTPSNLNCGLALAGGELLCRVDARSRIPPDYVRICVEVLTSRVDVAVVGGAQHAVPGATGAVARGITRALNNRYTTGLARYRRRATSGPTDTVYLGAFRTSQLRAAGGWDERLPTNQDFDLNRRMSRPGSVWFDTRLAVDYVARSSLRSLWRQYRRFGTWKVTYWRLRGERPRFRQWLLLVAPLAGMFTVLTMTAVRPHLIPWIAGGGVAAALLVDEVGSIREKPATLAMRVWALVAGATLAVGWWTGVMGAALRRERRESFRRHTIT